MDIYICIYAFVCHMSIWFAGKTSSKPGSYAKHYYIWTLSDTSNYFLVISPQLKFRVLSLRETKLYWVVYVYQTNVSPEFSQHWMPKILALWKYTIGI